MSDELHVKVRHSLGRIVDALRYLLKMYSKTSRTDFTLIEDADISGSFFTPFLRNSHFTLLEEAIPFTFRFYPFYRLSLFLRDRRPKGGVFALFCQFRAPNTVDDLPYRSVVGNVEMLLLLGRWIEVDEIWHVIAPCF